MYVGVFINDKTLYTCKLLLSLFTRRNNETFYKEAPTISYSCTTIKWAVLLQVSDPSLEIFNQRQDNHLLGIW